MAEIKAAAAAEEAARKQVMQPLQTLRVQPLRTYAVPLPLLTYAALQREKEAAAAAKEAKKKKKSK